MAKLAGKLARRYANAFLRAVTDEQGADGSPTPAQRVAQSLEQFAEIWRQSPELSRSMLNPMFDKDERLKALHEVARAAGMPDVALRLLTVVFERDRIQIFDQIVEAFKNLADSAAGVVHVQVALARGISDDERGKIEETLRHKIGGSLRFAWSVDPELLGGMVIRYSGKVVDGSLQGRLERMERMMMAS